MDTSGWARRRFLRTAALAAGATAAPCVTCHPSGGIAADRNPVHDGAVFRCEVCARNCIPAAGERGLCRARIHVAVDLRSLV